MYLKQSAVTKERAEVEVKTKASNQSGQSQNVSAVATVRDATGKEIASVRANGTAPPNETTDLVGTLHIDGPHLWNGVADPYLYTVQVSLYQDTKLVDTVEQPLGLRYFHQDPKLGYQLNGRSFQIHGVCRHQDGGPSGWAITEQQQDADMATMREMGVNGVRLVHYEHNPYFYGLCDRNGLLTWTR